ncbi:hypothetical protein J7E70_32020 [Variovorax paradoxus]|nr:hypothetical protein [Variovorax paradoxus]
MILDPKMTTELLRRLAHPSAYGPTLDGAITAQLTQPRVRTSSRQSSRQIHDQLESRC